MNLPRSNPDLSINNFPVRRQSKRQSRRQSRNSKQMKHIQFKISNPFRSMEQQNLLPPHIRNQLQQMQYISTNSIKTIEIPEQIDIGNNRRNSTFMKNIQMMQQLAKMQQQKYTGMLKQGTKTLNKKIQKNEKQHLPLNINMGQDDRISLQLNGFYDYKQRIDDDFDIFQHDMMEIQDKQVHQYNPIHGDGHQHGSNVGYGVFYSQQQLQPSYEMDEQFNNYLR